MALFHQILLAQVLISSDANGFRCGDQLCKVQVDYVDPGDGGPSEVWPLGRITRKSKEFLQTIVSTRDTVAIFERDRIQHYLVRGDSLLDKGDQSRRAYCLYDQERPLLCFPFHYGDSISGFFSGQGQEENFKTSRSGWGYTVADGMGILTDGEDSIPHVTRLHFFDDYTNTYYSGDTISCHILCDRYSWYCAGYRYPVMESVYWSSIREDSKIQPLDSITYLFLPVMQMDLAEDAVNDSLLTELTLAEALRQAASSKTGPLTSITAGLSSDGLHLNICYTLAEAGDITFRACDILGNMLGYKHYDSQEVGEWQECLELSRKPVGNTLMLNILCGNQEESKTVYK